MYYGNKYCSIYNIDEIQVKIGSELIWIWVDIEPKDKEILRIAISKEKENMFIAKRFLSSFKRIWKASNSLNSGWMDLVFSLSLPFFKI